MRVELVEISNFRCFDKFDLRVDGHSLFLVSENAGGKTSLLAAIYKALGRDRNFTKAEFIDPTQPIEISVTLSGFDPADQSHFPKELSFKGKPTLKVGVRVVWDKDEEEPDVTFGFPDQAWRVASRQQREALRILWLPAHRDPSRVLQLAARRGLLGGLISTLNLDAPLATAVAEISKALKALASTPDISTLLNDARDRLARLIPGVGANPFSIGFDAAEDRELLEELQLLLSHSGPDLPVAQQSNGLAQLAVFVFALRVLSLEPKAILLVDEPEISIHPQAQRALIASLRSLSNQVLVATHSSNVLDRADARTIVRLYRSGKSVKHAWAKQLGQAEAERLARFANTQTTEACFARKIVLVEGYSDRIALLRLQTRLDRNLDAEGITIISLDGGSAIAAHLQLFGKSGLQLEILGICDEDKGALWLKELQKAGYTATDRGSMQAQGFFVCVKDLEQEFIRVLGIAGTQAVIAAEGEAGTFAAFSKQPSQAGKTQDEQLRSFLHKDNTRWAAPLVDALDLKAIPGPLNDLFNRLK